MGLVAEHPPTLSYPGLSSVLHSHHVLSPLPKLVLVFLLLTRPALAGLQSELLDEEAWCFNLEEDMGVEHFRRHRKA